MYVLKGLLIHLSMGWMIDVQPLSKLHVAVYNKLSLGLEYTLQPVVILVIQPFAVALNCMKTK